MRVLVIADELTAAGWRMAGAQVRLPGAEAIEKLWQAADRADLVLISAELAAQLPAAVLDEARRRSQPLVLVIPDLLHRREPSDIEIDVRRALGVAI